MRITSFLRTLSVICLNGGLLWGQGTAQINGSARDQSGSIVPGATVKVTQTATGAVRTITTGPAGEYVFTALPVGPYLIEGSKEGFSKYVQSGVVLQVGANPTIDVVLQIGSLNEQVSVQADAALVETRNTGIGTVVDNQRVVELPLNGRQPTELIFLAGMANIGQGTGPVSSVRNYPTVVISVAGGINNGITYLLDGANHNDSYNNLNLPLPFPDALQEFKVETSALSAQYGLHSAAAVNVITKSGTNQFHGDLFEFLRNYHLNARNTLALTRDSLKRNQFGGVIGGPVFKDKLFFFAGYQGTTQRSEPTGATAFVPTAAMLAGDFRDYASAACQGTARTLSAAAGFVGNQISPARFNSASNIIEKRLPLATDPCGKVQYGIKSNQDENVGLMRLDYQKSDRHSMFGRFYVANLDQPTPYDGKNALTFTAIGTHDRVYSLNFGDTYLLGSSTVSSFRIAANRSEIPKTVVPFATWNELGVNASSFAAPMIRFTVSGNGFAIGGGNTIISEPITGPDVSLNEDISMNRGSHQIGFGGMFLRTTISNKSGLNATGATTINGQTSGLPLSDFLLGAASGWSQGNLQLYYLRQKYFAFYLQDTWKATSRLTINYGVRYEPYLPIYAKYPWVSHFDQARFDQNLRSSVFVNAPAGVIFPGDAAYTAGTAPHEGTWNKFVPRIGLVWDPKGDGKMTIRASYGIFTERFNFNSYTAFSQAPPFGNNITLNGGVTTPINVAAPWATYPGGQNPLPIQPEKNMTFPSFASYVTHPLKLKPMYLNQWNLTIQRQIGTNWLLTGTYLGNNTIHMPAENQLNAAQYLGPTSTTGNVNQRRNLYLKNPAQGQYFAYVNELDDGGTANYNGLYLAAQRRLSNGISVLANYTWSHCISDLWNGWVGNNGSSSARPGDRRADRGNCLTSDSRQVFNLSMVAQSPKFTNRLLSAVAGNWQLSPIVRLRSSDFLTVHTGTVGVSGQGGNSQLPGEHAVLLDPANIYPANQTADGWINRSAFGLPAPGTWGNLGFFNIKGPGTVTIDMGLSRTFTIREGKTLQARLEAFNVPNLVNYAAPVSTLNSGNFGKILTARDPRIMQVALKYVF